MKQDLKVVVEDKSFSYEKEVNKLLEDGYKIKNTGIRQVSDGLEDSYTVYQAILVKEIEE